MLTDREKRCLTRSWEGRKGRVDKHLADRKRYLTTRAAELQERADIAAKLIARLRAGLQGDVQTLLIK